VIRRRQSGLSGTDDDDLGAQPERCVPRPRVRRILGHGDARRVTSDLAQGATSSVTLRVCAELPPTIRSNAPGSTTHLLVGP